MFEYFKENYSSILTLVFIIICFILMIVQLFKKDDNTKKELNLVLFKENKYTPEITKYSNTYALFRRFLSIYQVILFNKKGNRILYSNTYCSREKIINNFNTYKEFLKSSDISFQETIDSKYYAIFMKENKAIAFTPLFDTFSKLQETINEINESIDSAFIDIPVFDNSIESYSRFNKPKKIRNLEIEKTIDNYSIFIKHKDKVLLKSYSTNDKNDLKKLCNDLEEALLSKRIFIENTDNKYRYLILSKSYEIAAFGELKDSKEDVVINIEELLMSLN